MASLKSPKDRFTRASSKMEGARKKEHENERVTKGRVNTSPQFRKGQGSASGEKLSAKEGISECRRERFHQPDCAW